MVCALVCVCVCVCVCARNKAGLEHARGGSTQTPKAAGPEGWPDVRAPGARGGPPNAAGPPALAPRRGARRGGGRAAAPAHAHPPGRVRGDGRVLRGPAGRGERAARPADRRPDQLRAHPRGRRARRRRSDVPAALPRVGAEERRRQLPVPPLRCGGAVEMGARARPRLRPPRPHEAAAQRLGGAAQPVLERRRAPHACPVRVPPPDHLRAVAAGRAVRAAAAAAAAAAADRRHDSRRRQGRLGGRRAGVRAPGLRPDRRLGRAQRQGHGRHVCRRRGLQRRPERLGRERRHGYVPHV